MRCAVPWETVLGDKDSTDDTGRLHAEFRGRAPVPCRVIHEPQLGSSHAKITGWRAARAPILCFTDDDCYPARNFLDPMLAAPRRALDFVLHGCARGRGACFLKFLLRPRPRLTLLKRGAGCARCDGLSWLPLELVASAISLLHRAVRPARGRT